MLKRDGHNVVHTDDFFNLVDTVFEVNPQLILLDIVLPEVSGVELANQLRSVREFDHIPVVAITAVDFSLLTEEHNIFDDVISKICSPEELRSEIKRFV
jgi:two-component system OmpR family response regulator/two-component system alkaline phosphatase synthesis response regulator PhoP